MSEATSVVPGWYGKIPALGDFASRRLPTRFISQWDTWLQHGIATSRAQLAERWLDLYLTSPIWRFALLPGVCGEHTWAGVLMPSVDKVGRHFPLTLAVALAPPVSIASVFAAHDWYAAIERVALAALRLDGSLDDLEQDLALHPFPLNPTPATAEQPESQSLAQWWQSPIAEPLALPLNGAAHVEELVSATMRSLFAAASQGKSVWWSSDPDSGAGALHCCTGLPPHDYLRFLLQGGSQLTMDPANTWNSSQN